MTSSLAIETLDKAIKAHNVDPTKLTIYTDQGTQYTSLEFMNSYMIGTIRLVHIHTVME